MTNNLASLPLRRALRRALQYGTVRSGPLVILCMEAAVLCGAMIWLCSYSGYSWPTLTLFFFAPDIALFGYLAGARVGAILYNALHTLIGPLLLAGFGHLSGAAPALWIAAAWAAHINFDRAIGYGLKYAVGFERTHLDSPIYRLRLLRLLRGRIVLARVSQSRSG